MHIEARIWEGLTVFFLFVAVMYAVATSVWQPGGIEWTGVTALVLSGGLTLITGTYFRFVARRIDERPEDYPDAEISDGAGELGFFSPGSFWPVLLAFGAALAGVALALRLFWLVIVTVVLIIVFAAGLVFEYHRGPEKH